MLGHFNVKTMFTNKFNVKELRNMHKLDCKETTVNAQAILGLQSDLVVRAFTSVTV